MEFLPTILFLMVVLIGLYSIADKIKISYPILLVLAGLAIGFAPDLPHIELEPDIVFLIFLPPLLYEAAWHTSWHDFKRHLRPISAMAVGLVFATTAGVAAFAYYFIPGFTWPLAFLLGAIVSPPDAVAATSATKGLGLPRKVVTILEGESLLNDASAIIAFRFALAVVIGGTFDLTQAEIQFAYVALGGIGIGLAIAWITAYAHKHLLHNSTVESCVTLLIPYISYLVAEHFHCSGVLAVVTTGLYMSWKSSELFSVDTRMKVLNIWESFSFLLNGLVFILIGLQLPYIIHDLNDKTMWGLVRFGLLVSLVALVIRFCWVFPVAYLDAFINWVRGRKTAITRQDLAEMFIISWAGMRGVVSLAAALAIPLTLADGSAFPERSAILLITFTVIFVTLVFQGLPLPLLVKFFKVYESPEAIAKEERQLRLKLSNECLTYIKENFAPTMGEAVITELNEIFENRVKYIKRNLAPPDEIQDEDNHEFLRQYVTAQIELVEMQRSILIDKMKRDSISHGTLRKLEHELDVKALNLNQQLAFLDRI